MSNIFSLNWRNVASAVVSGVLAAVIGYLSTLTNILSINVEQVISLAVIAALSSLLKAFSSDTDGKFLGKI